MTDEVIDQTNAHWLKIWPEATQLWSPFVKLQDPILCAQSEHEKKEGLSKSFAMIRFTDHRVVISMRQIIEQGLEDYALEILAHEVGHHFQYPANLRDYGQVLFRVKKVLDRHAQYAPLILNLYTDLLINNRLFRLNKLRMDEVYRALKNPENTDSVWNLYLRIYERLWQLPKSFLGNALSPEMELEADIGARIIRIYAQDWKKGAVRFALLFQHHFDQYNEEKSIQIGPWMDIHGVDGGDVPPDGLSHLEAEQDDLTHPFDDDSLMGNVHDSTELMGDQDSKLNAASRDGHGLPDQRKVNGLGPAEYIQLLKDIGVRGNPKDWVVQYYKEQARPLMISFPGKLQSRSADPLPESLDVWDTGSPMVQIDWMESLFRSPHVIPGVTTVERVYGVSQGGEPEVKPPDVYIGVDCSGSMANPASRTSYPALAGAVILLSALRAGARAMVCLSGEFTDHGSFKETDGFMRNEKELMRTLTDYLGTGSYYSPRHLVRTFLKEAHQYRDTHVLVLSDTDLFHGVDQIENGWALMAKVAQDCGSGATAVLNLGQHGRDRNKEYIQRFHDVGWDVAIVSSEPELLKFAREFSQKTYEE